MGYRKRVSKDGLSTTYEVSVCVRRERAFATAATEQEAMEKVIELKAGLIQKHRAKAGAPPLPPSPSPSPSATSWTLERAIKTAFEVRWNGTKSESFYRTKTKVLLAHFGSEKLLSEINTAEVDAFKAVLRKRGNTQATINHALIALSVVYNTAEERDGVTTKKPKLGIRKSARGRVRWVTEEEETVMLALLRQWKKDDMADWTEVMVDTGMRPSETKAMTGEWCDFRQGAIHVQESKSKAGLRVIPMTTRVRAILERRCLTRPKGSLFPYGWATYRHVWDLMEKAMGLTEDKDFVPYCLRHTFGTRLVQRGERIEVIQKLMGHEDPKQTMVYAKLGAAQYVAAISKLEKAPLDPGSKSGAVCGANQNRKAEPQEAPVPAPFGAV